MIKIDTRKFTVLFNYEYLSLQFAKRSSKFLKKLQFHFLASNIFPKAAVIPLNADIVSVVVVTAAAWLAAIVFWIIVEID